MTTDDPNFAPYPGRYLVAKEKGIPPNEDPVPLDITGTYDLQQQIDEIGRIIKRGPVPDGGLSWDHESRVVIVRLVGILDSPEVERLKEEVLAAADGFTVEFLSVRYSQDELMQLADGLFATASVWGPSKYIGGGWDCFENRVMIHVPEGTDETQAWIDAIERLGDPRIIVQTFTPRPERQRRLPGRE